ncbi:MAG: hypothetical protein JO318_04880 [Chloroflexi bacterium]|nr:hypothetical protein [Chloroflexota bacterium]
MRWISLQLIYCLAASAIATSPHVALADSVCYQFTIGPTSGEAADPIVVSLQVASLPQPVVEHVAFTPGDADNYYLFRHYDLLDVPGSILSFSYGGAHYAATPSDLRIDSYVTVRPAPQPTTSGLMLSMAIPRDMPQGDLTGHIVLQGAPPAALRDGAVTDVLPSLETFPENVARILGTDVSWAIDGRVTSISSDCPAPPGARTTPLGSGSAVTPVPTAVLLESTRTIDALRGGSVSTVDDSVRLIVPPGSVPGTAARIRLSVGSGHTPRGAGPIVVGNMDIAVVVMGAADAVVPAFNTDVELLVRPRAADLAAVGEDPHALLVGQVDIDGSGSVNSLPFSVDADGYLHIAMQL